MGFNFVYALFLPLFALVTACGPLSRPHTRYAVVVIPVTPERFPIQLESTSIDAAHPDFKVTNLPAGSEIVLLSGTNATCEGGMVHEAKVTLTDDEVIRATFAYAHSETVEFRVKALLPSGETICTSAVPYRLSLLEDLIQIEASNDHTCALRADGRVLCWGYNDDGQLGNGLNVDSLAPVFVDGLTDAIEINAGAYSTCARRLTGQAVCWGDNYAGQLGDGSTTDRNTPVTVSGLNNVAKISLGENHGCAVLTNGSLYCWGDNDDGQIGDNSTTARLTPVPITGVSSDVVDVEAGYYVSCAILDTGSVECWGSNASSAFGNGNTTDSLVPVPGATGLSDAVQIQNAGTVNFCARRSGGTVQCWGNNGFGQLGTGDTVSSPTPVTVPGLSGVVSLSGGSDPFFCAALNTGQVRCWGRNRYGSIGDGTQINQLSPASVLNISNAVQVTSGYWHSCAVLDSGRAQCWGSNNYGEIGVRDIFDTRTTPATVPTVHPFESLKSGVSHVCYTNSSGQVYCYGSNTSGKLGLGDTTDRSTGTLVPALSSLTAVSVTVGYDHSCAVLSDGTARCWGEAGSHQLGYNSTVDSFVPVAVQNLSGAVKITAGVMHTCAMKSDKTVMCWGENGSGQLGDTTTTDRPTAITVPGLTNVAEVVAGHDHTCARLEDKTVYCWGENSNNQIGNGLTADRTSPTLVAGLTNVEQISAGEYFTCARLTNGQAWCWGGNGNGRLGDGTTMNRSAPTQITTLSGVIDISAGQRNACAVLTDQTVKCWGFNSQGRLGDGTTTQRLSPVSVLNLVGAKRVYAGGIRVCAEMPFATLKCWGNEANTYLLDTNFVVGD